MRNLEIIFLSLSSIFALEFVIFSGLIVYDIRIYYIYELCMSRSQKLFNLLMLLQCLIRVLFAILLGIFNFPDWLGTISALQNLLSLSCYFIILYLWYKIYLNNNYHLTQEQKDSRLNTVKKLFIVINLISVLFYCILCGTAIEGWDMIEKGDNIQIGLRVFQIYAGSVIFCGVYYIGIKLLRQIRKYAYDTPHILLASLYVSLGGLALGIVGLGVIVAAPYEYKEICSIISYSIAQNFIELIPFWIFYVFLKKHHQCREEDKSSFDFLDLK